MRARLGSSTLLALFALHWTATGLHMLPWSPWSGDGDSPWAGMPFDQHWMLFAPDPPVTNRRFEVRCGDGPWFDPVAPLLRQHERWRISWHGELVRLYAQPGRDLGGLIELETREACAPDDSGCPERKMDRLMASAPVQQADALARQSCPPEVDRVQFRITFVPIPPLGGGPTPPSATFESDPVRLAERS